MNLFGVLQEAYPLLLTGLGMTLKITAISLVFAIIIGIVSCLFSISKAAVLRGISKVYLWIIRGTPMLVQGMYIYFAIPQLMEMITGSSFKITVETASVVTLMLNAGAYISEIFRGAIEAVNKGQMEAARSLGMSYGKSMIKVILPQAVRICLPSLVNQFIITLKDSTILYAIGLAEIMYYGKIYVGKTYQSFATYTWIAIAFLIIITILTLVSKRIERRLKA